MEIVIEEVGLREGLQSNNQVLTLNQKTDLIDRMIEAGIQRIQLGSFVNPKRVPQMVGVEDLFYHYMDNDKTIFSGLVLNQKGLERAMDCGVKLLNVSISASNSHNKENTGKTIEESLEEIISLVKTASSHGLVVRGGIQAAFGCYLEGQVDTNRVVEIAGRMREAGATEIGLSDTAGFATPGLIQTMAAQI